MNQGSRTSPFTKDQGRFNGLWLNPFIHINSYTNDTCSGLSHICKTCRCDVRIYHMETTLTSCILVKADVLKWISYFHIRIQTVIHCWHIDYSCFHKHRFINLQTSSHCFSHFNLTSQIPTLVSAPKYDCSENTIFFFLNTTLRN